MSRLCDRVPRRASPGLDTDLNGLALGFSYPGKVRFSGNTLTAIHLSQSQLTPESIRQKTVWSAADDAPTTRDLPTTRRTRSKFTVSSTPGLSVHFGSDQLQAIPFFCGIPTPRGATPLPSTVASGCSRPSRREAEQRNALFLFQELERAA